MTRLPAKGASGSKAIYMTDGYITLALLENKAEGKPSGLNHFGFEVEDHEEITNRLVKGASRPPPSGRPTGPMPRPARPIPTAITSTSRSRASAPKKRSPKPRKEPATA